MQVKAWLARHLGSFGYQWARKAAECRLQLEDNYISSLSKRVSLESIKRGNCDPVPSLPYQTPEGERREKMLTERTAQILCGEVEWP